MSPPPGAVDLTGGRALVADGDHPVGAAVARALAAAGVRPALLGRDRDAVGAVARETGGAAWVADGADPAATGRLVADVVADLGAIDIVVTGPGRTWAADLSATDAGTVDDLLAANLGQPLHVLGAALPGLVAKGRGHAVLIGAAPGGLLGAAATPGSALQATTMGGLAGLAAALRGELHGTGVKVSLVRTASAAPARPALRLRAGGGDPPGPITPEDVATAVVEALRHGRPEVVVPAWLGAAPRLQALAPHAWAAVAGRLRRR